MSGSENYTAGVREIQRDGRLIGSIQLVLSHAEVKSQIAADRGAIAILALAVLGTIALASILISRQYIARPLDRLSQSAIAIRKGDLEAEIDTSGQDEIGTLARRFNEMRNSIGRLVADLNVSKAKLQDANLKLEERVSVTSESGFNYVEGATPHDRGDDVDISPVPLPATGWMLVVGLGGLLTMRRRRAVTRESPYISCNDIYTPNV